MKAENGQSDNGGDNSSAANPLSRQADSEPASASSSGPVRRNRTVNRKSPYPAASPNQSAGRWQHDRYISSDITSATLPSTTTLPPPLLPTLLPAPTSSSTIQRVVGDTIHLTNLHHDVKPDDLYDIFSPLGHIRSHTVHFDERGRSLGTATITFTRPEIAEAAVAEFDGAEIDGKVMSVKLVGQLVQQRLGGGAGGGSGGPMVGSYLDQLNPAAAAMMLPAMLQMMAGGMSAATQQLQRQQAGGGKGSRDRAGQRGDKQRGEDRGKGKEQSKAAGAAAGDKAAVAGKGGRGKQERPPVTAEDLDAEMESYHTQRNATSTTAAGESSSAAGAPPAEISTAAVE